MACDCGVGESCRECLGSRDSSPVIEEDLATRTANYIESFAGPIRLAYGLQGSARIKQKVIEGGVVRFEWEAAIEQREDLRIIAHPLYAPTLVYPSSINLQNENELLEQEGNRLHTLGDTALLDAASELLPQTPIHPTILLNSIYTFDPARAQKIDSNFEPNYGNCLSAITITSKSKRKEFLSSNHVLWRSGDADGRGTDITHGLFDGNGHNSDDKVPYRETQTLPPFRPTLPTFISTSISPLLQMELSPLDSGSSGLLAIRSSTSISISQIEFAVPDHFIEPLPVVNTFEYCGRDFNRRAIADIALGGIQGGIRGSGLLVDVQGSLFGFGLSEDSFGRVGGECYTGTKPEMFRLRSARRSDSSYSGFARVVWGGSRGMDAVVGFEDEVLVFDIRSPTASLTLVDSKLLSSVRAPLLPTALSPLLTSLTRPSSSTPFQGPRNPTSRPTPYHTVCTTKDVIWLDERMPGKEVMSWTHGRLGRNGRGVDRTLSLMSVPTISSDDDDEETVSRLLLHSRLHSHLTFYTYSGSEFSPIRSLLDPYSLDSPVATIDKSWNRSGLSIAAQIEDKEDEKEEGWIIIETGTKGDVYSRFASTRDQTRHIEAQDSLPVRLIWTPEIEEMKLEVDLQKEPTREGLELSTAEVLDLRIPYQNVFGEPVEDSEDDDSADERERIEEREELEIERRKQLLEEIVAENVELQLDEDAEDRGAITALDLAVHASKRHSEAISNNRTHDSSPSTLPALPRSANFLSSHSPSIHSFTTERAIGSLDALARIAGAKVPWSTSLYESDPSQRKEFQKSFPDLSSWSELPSRAEEMAKRYSGESDSKMTAAASKQVLLDVKLASEIYSTRAMEPSPLSMSQNNSSYPIDQPPPSLHFHYFRPRPSPDFANREEEIIVGSGSRKRKLNRPSLELSGARALLSEWQIGSDPTSYNWQNPYINETKKELELEYGENSSQGRKKLNLKNREFEGEEPLNSSQYGFGSKAFPPAFAPRKIDPIREESSPVRLNGDQSPRNLFGFNSQPNFSRPEQVSSQFDSQSQDRRNGGASQVLPGTFGGRIEKKKKKKRISGF